MNTIAIANKATGNTREKRHETELSFTKSNPRSTHRASVTPTPSKTPSVTTFEPRLGAGDIPDCQTGTVARYPPIPRPRTSLATVNWAK